MRSPEKNFSKRIQVVGAIIIENDETKSPHEKKVLLVQRSAHDSGAGLWEFPGGKIENGESPKQALVREIEEELCLNINIIDTLGTLTHQYPKVTVDLEVFIAKIISGALTLHEHQDKKWLKADEINENELLDADKPFVQKLIRYLQNKS